MADVVPNEGIANMLKLATQQSVPIKARLFRNDVTPTAATTLGALTEANHSGYAAQVLEPVADPVMTPNGKVMVQSMDVVFSHDGGLVGNSIYGYYVTIELETGPALWFAGRFKNAPLPMQAAEDEIEFSVDVLGTQET